MLPAVVVDFSVVAGTAVDFPVAAVARVVNAVVDVPIVPGVRLAVVTVTASGVGLGPDGFAAVVLALPESVLAVLAVTATVVPTVVSVASLMNAESMPFASNPPPRTPDTLIGS